MAGGGKGSVWDVLCYAQVNTGIEMIDFLGVSMFAHAHDNTFIEILSVYLSPTP